MQNELTSINSSSGAKQLEFRQVIYVAISNWYWVLLSLVFAIFLAVAYNRYATKIYAISASIIIKEVEDNPEGLLLSNNPLLNLNKNYLNELYVVKSYPLIKSTICKLNSQVAFFEEGNVITSESYYKDIPIKVVVLESDADVAFQANLERIDATTFKLTSQGGNAELFSHVFHYNDTVKVMNTRFVFFNNSANTKENRWPKKFGFSYTPSPQLTSLYIGRIRAKWAEKGSGVINISLEGQVPQKEIDFVNGLVAEYESYNLRKKNLTASRTIEFISQQLEGISDSLRHAERELELFKNANVVTDLSTEAIRVSQRLEGFEFQKAEILLRFSYYDYLLKYLEEKASPDQIVLPSSMGINDNLLANLISKMVDLQLEMKMVALNMKADNPIVSDRKKKLSQIRADVIESIVNQKVADQLKLSYLERNIATLVARLNKLPGSERQLVAIKRNYSLLENLYVFLLQKRAEAGITKASNSSDVVIVNPPLVDGLVSPKASLNFGIALILGFAIPLLIFALQLLLDTRVQVLEDVSAIVSLPILGTAGHKTQDSNLEVLSKPKSIVSESFRALRSNLSFFSSGKNCNVYLVTSSISGEGKTFVSVNLGTVFALSSKKTLIVGADMRRPKIFNDFQLSNEVGLSTYLAGLADFESVVQKTTHENLFITAGGAIPPNPAELIESDRMRQFIEEAKARFDVIVIDSPPLAVVSDTWGLVKLVDHTIFVVRQNFTPKFLMGTLKEYHESRRLPNISILLNDIQRSKGKNVLAKYAANSKYHYDYYGGDRSYYD